MADLTAFLLAVIALTCIQKSQPYDKKRNEPRHRITNSEKDNVKATLLFAMFVALDKYCLLEYRGIMIKILGISGSPVKDGNVVALLKESLSHIQDRDDVETDVITLVDKKFNGCNHCNWCVRNQTEEQFCNQNDDMGDIYPRILETDGLILATPVHFGRLSGLMANMIDRLRVFVYGKVYREHLRNKVGGAMAVAFSRGGGIETTLSSINSMFFVFRMIVATSQRYQLGAASFTSNEGKGRVDKSVRYMALEDDFGTNSARLLVDRILELAKIVKAGEISLKKLGKFSMVTRN